MTTKNVPRKMLKSALHHWWPRSLSRFWAADDGCVTQLWWDGREVRQEPAKFGAIGNAHHLKFGEDSPWNSSFEHHFQRADEAFPELARWLLALDVKRASEKAPFQNRFLAQPLSNERRHQLAECLASLIVRSPRSRNNIRITVEPHREGLPDPRADKTLIAANMVQSQDAFRRAIESGGKFVVLLTDSQQEFICGDGFLHDFPVVPEYIFSRRCIIPILPTVTVLFVQPTSYRPQPELITIFLRENEVKFLNTIIQIYSKDFVFYRNDKLDIIENFVCHEFMMFEYNDHPVLNNFIASAVAFSP